MEPIRILHIVGAMNRGGAETLLMELYRHIDRTKVQFDFLIYNYSNKPGEFDAEIKSLGGKIYNANGRFFRNPFVYYKELKHFLKEHPEYKVIHSHLNSMSGFAFAAAKSTTKSFTIVHSHSAFVINDILHSCANKIGRMLLKKYADICFGCSNDAVFEITKQNANQKDRFVINNAIDIEKFAFSQDMRQNWREQLGADNETLVLGNVARFTSEKNHRHSIKVFSEILKKNDDAILVFVGGGQLRNQVENFAKEQGVYEKVKFLGVRPDVQDIINAFDVFIMPSQFEGLGIVLIEAQANGLPCVMSADVIPAEADTGAGLVTRVSLDETPEKWADACLNAGKRKTSEEVRPTIIDAGFDINAVSAWLQDFYINHWN